ncbi:hypothetical protein [Kitasatospora sp. NPDC018619]|uniref:hypothetical protein n=1 Tax=unclassified Kitasatospora TaxID=2633591 RepID=UPI0037BC642E
MPDISRLLDGARPREQAVLVCLDGGAAAELGALEDELAALDGWQPTSLGDTDPRTELAARVAERRSVLAAASVEFRFQALGHRAFSALVAAHPPQHGSSDLYGPTFLPALLAACCTSPTLSPGQVDQLLDRVNHGTAQELFAAALAVNEEPSPLPF